MGDGFTIDDDDQKLQQGWAKLCLDVLWSELAYGEYKDYFNYYFVRLASLEEGVDKNASPEEKKKGRGEEQVAHAQEEAGLLDGARLQGGRSAGPGARGSQPRVQVAQGRRARRARMP